MWRDKKGAIFDMDGTLMDSMWIWRDIDIEYLGRFGIALPEDLQAKIEGLSFAETAIALSFIVISCSDNKDEPEPSKDHEYVDLGLPSGTLWATYNVGANTPEGYGDYFTWGETKPKDVYDMASNKWFSLCHDSIGTYWKVMKYNSISSVGVVDNKTELDPEDDAAYVNWGASWRMPTLAQQKELIRLRCMSLAGCPTLVIIHEL